MRNSHIEIAPIAGALGAEIQGVDVSRPMDEALFAEIRQAFHDRSVIFFRDQAITPEQHVAFARRFGPINVNRFFTAVPGHPEIAEVRKEPEQKKNIGETWHTDHSYDEVPALGSMLVARDVPDHGGDTMFASMYAAYDALSDGLKRTLEGLRAVHSSRHIFGPEARYHDTDLKGRLHNPDAATQDAVHPVVIRHPDTGRKALYVNSNFTVGIEGWTREESEALLGFLYRHGQRPEFTCRFRWRNGSIALWDNRSTWHCAVNDYHGQRRLMHRITIEGSPLH
ncbi:TauD/TfdA dioxygenase family protein [Falsiroseomonas sp.]|uniref:TauD/TfdA dioxygenase family protein n=1 Tax=Falsiroseomonas sp. TaxID=2870721 RepID=UPI0035639E7B